jgi:hypothetical protein
MRRDRAPDLPERTGRIRGPYTRGDGASLFKIAWVIWLYECVWRESGGVKDRRSATIVAAFLLGEKSTAKAVIERVPKRNRCPKALKLCRLTIMALDTW